MCETENKLGSALKSIEDASPRLGLTAHSTEGPKAWREHGRPVIFSIHHLAGRVPTSLSFDPISSKNGRFKLQFDSLPHLTQGDVGGVDFDIIEVGAPALNATDRETTKKYVHKELLGSFLDDSPRELLELDYLVIVRFMDQNVRREQRFDLVFDKKKWRLTCSPALPKPL